MNRNGDIRKDVPLVSVCTITYNQSPYIRQCLDGILKQETNFIFEMVVGEDESTDGTREICVEYEGKYPEKIQLILRSQSEADRKDFVSPAIYNWVSTLQACKGKYIAICEGDDYWHNPHKLQTQVDFMESHPEYSMCHSETNYNDMVNNRFVRNDHASSKRRHDQDNVSEAHVCGDYVVRTCTIIARTEQVKRIAKEHLGEFSRFIAGDMITVFHLSLLGRVHYMEESLATYRRVPGSVTGLDDSSRRLKFIFAAATERLYFCDHYNLSRACLDAVLKMDLSVLLGLCLKCRSKSSLSQIYKMYKGQPFSGVPRILYFSTTAYWLACGIWTAFRLLSTQKRVWCRFIQGSRKFVRRNHDV
ncbi:MAG: glycosyltransferase [Kiritimatiellales bacterium]